MTPVFTDLDTFIKANAPTDLQQAWQAQRAAFHAAEAHLVLTTSGQFEHLYVLPHRAERDGSGV